MGSPSEPGQPSCQFRLLHTSDERHLLAMRGTHELLDGWASALVSDDLGYAYAALFDGRRLEKPRPTSLRSFTRWYHQLLADGHLEASRRYWEQLLSGAKRLYPTPPAAQAGENTYRSLSAVIPFPLPLRNDFEALCLRQKATMFEGCLTAYRRVLSNRTQTDSDGLLAFVTALRETHELQSVVGSLTNRMYMRVALTESDDFSGELEQVRQDLRTTQEHSLWPAWREVDPQGSGFPDMFFHYVAPQSRAASVFAGLTLAPQPPQTPSYWPLGCAFQVVDHQERPLLLCLARAGYCDDAFLQRLMSDFLETVSTILEEAKQTHVHHA